MNVLPVEGDRPAIDLLEAVDRADECRFARAGWTADDHDFTSGDLSVDFFQNLTVARLLGNLGDPDRIHWCESRASAAYAVRTSF